MYKAQSAVSLNGSMKIACNAICWWHFINASNHFVPRRVRKSDADQDLASACFQFDPQLKAQNVLQLYYIMV